ncbi:hypothetical protein DRN62_00160 [Nanoarchaeota archaeon]|nr:ribosomal L7Ae/L30e/S12e/Gadd45 family protein [Nanoarchaeota archaeon]RLG17794.1 MAG: hypothetical protein DRN62_00160 [Nanoarchaeota archaeon]
MGIRSEVKSALEKGKLLIGFNSVRKGLMAGKVKKVILAKNCPLEIRERMLHYGEIGGVPVEVFRGDSTSLGVLCKKSFNVLVVGIRK